jgi:multidrug resistance efflux pump
VSEVLVEVGDWVNQGDVLVRLDNQRQSQQVAVSNAHLELAQAQLERLINGARKQERDQARAELSAVQARLEKAQRSWARVQQLRVQQAVSQQESDDQHGLVKALSAEVDAARAQLEQIEAPARSDELRVAQARVAAAQADHELARIALNKTQLRAPQRGQVLDLNVEPGELIGADSPKPTVEVADTSELRVRAYVEEIDAPRLQVGMDAQIEADGLRDRVFPGQIISLSPRMSAKSITSGSPDEMFDTKVREVLLEIQDGESLLVGLRVDVVFDIAAGDASVGNDGESRPPMANDGEDQIPNGE